MATGQTGLTGDGTEELDGVPVPVEAELRLCHGAVGDERARRDAVTAAVAVDADHTARSPRRRRRQRLLVACENKSLVNLSENPN